jgi:hypothetical protein
MATVRILGASRVKPVSSNFSNLTYKTYNSPSMFPSLGRHAASSSPKPAPGLTPRIPTGRPDRLPILPQPIRRAARPELTTPPPDTRTGSSRAKSLLGSFTCRSAVIFSGARQRGPS